jgi:hypothetical protein
MNRKK